MAVLHNEAGQSHKERARQAADCFVVVGSVVLVVTAALFGAFLANFRYPPAVLLLLAAGVAIYLFARRLGGMWDKLWTEQVAYLRGGQAEAYVAWMLYYLPDDWHVFNNLMIRPDQDLDHVVVGPGGLFAISTKPFRGLLSAMPGGPLPLNNDPTDIGDDALRQAMRLRDLLAEKFDGADVPFVNAVLAAPLAYTRLVNPVRNVRVLHQGDLIEALAKMPGKLSPAAVRRIVAVLETFPIAGDRPADPSGRSRAGGAG